jgi:hypothetical protein
MLSFVNFCQYVSVGKEHDFLEKRVNETDTKSKWNEFVEALKKVNGKVDLCSAYKHYGLDFDREYEIRHCTRLSEGQAELEIYDQMEQSKAADLCLSAEVASMNDAEICEINIRPHVLKLSTKIPERRDLRCMLAGRFMVLVNTEPLCFQA